MTVRVGYPIGNRRRWHLPVKVINTAIFRIFDGSVGMARFARTTTICVCDSIFHTRFSIRPINHFREGKNEEICVLSMLKTQISSFLPSRKWFIGLILNLVWNIESQTQIVVVRANRAIPTLPSNILKIAVLITFTGRCQRRRLPIGYPTLTVI